MVAFGDETTYGRVLEYSERLDESDKDSPDGAMMEFILQESMTFGNGLAVLETQAKLVRGRIDHHRIVLTVSIRLLFYLEW
jgi:flavin-binding protein dodecin